MKKININLVLWLSGIVVAAMLITVFLTANHLKLWATVTSPAPVLRIISDHPEQPSAKPAVKSGVKPNQAATMAKEVIGLTAEHHGVMVKAADKTGVSWQVLASLFFTESTNGKNLGSHDPKKVMSNDQYEAFLRICRDIGRNPATVKVGGCGEMGPFQFMPTTWEFIGVDANGDGVKNPFSVQDASVSAGKYLIYRGYKNDPEESVRRYKGGTKGEELADRVVGKTMALATAMGMAG